MDKLDHHSKGNTVELGLKELAARTSDPEELIVRKKAFLFDSFRQLIPQFGSFSHVVKLLLNEIEDICDSEEYTVIDQSKIRIPHYVFVKRLEAKYRDYHQRHQQYTLQLENDISGKAAVISEQEQTITTLQQEMKTSASETDALSKEVSLLKEELARKQAMCDKSVEELTAKMKLYEEDRISMSNQLNKVQEENMNLSTFRNGYELLDLSFRKWKPAKFNALAMDTEDASFVSFQPANVLNRLRSTIFTVTHQEVQLYLLQNELLNVFDDQLTSTKDNLLKRRLVSDPTDSLFEVEEAAFRLEADVFMASKRSFVDGMKRIAHELGLSRQHRGAVQREETELKNELRKTADERKRRRLSEKQRKHVEFQIVEDAVNATPSNNGAPNALSAPERNAFVAQEASLSLLAAVVRHSTDDGRSFHPLAAGLLTSFCASCAATTTVCPHRLFEAKKVDLRLPRGVTHLRIERPLARVTTLKEAANARNEELSAKQVEGKNEDPSFGDLATNRDFNALWLHYTRLYPDDAVPCHGLEALGIVGAENSDGERSPDAGEGNRPTRERSLEWAYEIVEEFQAFLYRVDGREDVPKSRLETAPIDRLLVDFVRDRYDSSVASLAARDIVAALIRHAGGDEEKENDSAKGRNQSREGLEKEDIGVDPEEEAVGDLFLQLVCHCLLGRMNWCVVGYALMLGELVGTIDWQTSGDYLAFVRAVYPTLVEPPDGDEGGGGFDRSIRLTNGETISSSVGGDGCAVIDMDSVQLNFVSYTQNRVSTAVVWQYIVYLLLRGREPRALYFADEIRRLKRANAATAPSAAVSSFLSVEELRQFCDVLLPTVGDEERRRVVHAAVAQRQPLPATTATAVKDNDSSAKGGQKATTSKNVKVPIEAAAQLLAFAELSATKNDIKGGLWDVVLSERQTNPSSVVPTAQNVDKTDVGRVAEKDDSSITTTVRVASVLAANRVTHSALLREAFARHCDKWENQHPID